MNPDLTPYRRALMVVLWVIYQTTKVFINQTLAPLKATVGAKEIVTRLRNLPLYIVDITSFPFSCFVVAAAAAALWGWDTAPNQYPGCLESLPVVPDWQIGQLSAYIWDSELHWPSSTGHWEQLEIKMCVCLYLYTHIQEGMVGASK